MSWQVVDVRKGCTYDKTFWISTDVLQDAQVVLETWQHTEDCRARIEQEMLDKGDAIKLKTCGNQEEIVKELDISFEKEENW